MCEHGSVVSILLKILKRNVLQNMFVCIMDGLQIYVMYYYCVFQWVIKFTLIAVIAVILVEYLIIGLIWISHYIHESDECMLFTEYVLQNA